MEEAANVTKVYLRVAVLEPLIMESLYQHIQNESLLLSKTNEYDEQEDRPMRSQLALRGFHGWHSHSRAGGASIPGPTRTFAAHAEQSRAHHRRLSYWASCSSFSLYRDSGLTFSITGRLE